MQLVSKHLHLVQDTPGVRPHPQVGIRTPVLALHGAPPRVYTVTGRVRAKWLLHDMFTTLLVSLYRLSKLHAVKKAV